RRRAATSGDPATAAGVATARRPRACQVHASSVASHSANRPMAAIRQPRADGAMAVAVDFAAGAIELDAGAGAGVAAGAVLPATATTCKVCAGSVAVSALPVLVFHHCSEIGGKVSVPARV